MGWIRKQWNNNKEFRAAVVVLTGVGLSAAGLPPVIAQALGGLFGAVSF